MTYFALAAVAEAATGRAADFRCCHFPTAGASSGLSYVVVPLADRRPTMIKNVDELEVKSRLLGITRGGYGNPFGLYAQRPLRDYVTEALAGALASEGHAVTISTRAPALGGDTLPPEVVTEGVPQGTIVVHGSFDSFELDVSSFGTARIKASATIWSVEATQPGWSRTVQLDRDLPSFGEVRRLARAWHGRFNNPELYATDFELALIAFGEAFKEASATSPASGGCGKDTDCKGTRICVGGACVEAPP